MGRADIAYLLIMLIVASGIAVAVYTRRFAHYQRAVMRGNRPDKRVWKPFWLR